MSQTTLDQNTPQEGGAEQAKTKPPARNRRSSTHKKATAAQPAPAEAQPVAQEQPAPAPAAEVTAAPTQETPAPAEAQRQHTSSRGRSRNRGREGRKHNNNIQLVIPPQQQTQTPAEQAQAATEQPQPALANGTQAGEATPAVSQEITQTPAAEATPSENAEPRVVPVKTEATDAAQATPQPEQSPQVAPQPQPAPRRYRFDRRPSPAAAASLVRRERLSGPVATVITPAAPATQGPATSLATPAPAPTPTEAEERAWQANVAEVEPEDVVRSAAADETALQSQPAEQPAAPEPAGTDTAVDDLIAALGLRDIPSAPAPATPAEAEARTEPEHETLAEAETPAEATNAPEGEAGTAGRRRRRRRRGGAAHAGTAEEAEEERPIEAGWGVPAGRAPEVPSIGVSELERESGNGYEPYYPYAPAEQPYSPFGRAQRERPVAAQPGWDITQAHEAMRTPASPFGSPEPSFARGFGPQPRGVAGPLREPSPRPTRPERGMDMPPMSSNQLASVVSHALQQQTDRLLAELRHQAHPPSMTVQFPPFPSTERVGIFVDVANLLYSARTLRIQIDFGRLLDFLRGNRRLIRAHAYAPTNPDPNADQSFLAAVKGMGYRITTKNYKTFASGAKKADMDLDLCMDIVRLVDAKALDTVVLVSGDSDFLPLLEYCSDHGVRVEVAAFDDSAAMILRQSCDLFINLSVVDEIRI